jgi:predicted phage-related endonuclease
MPALTPANDLIRSRNVTASECYALLGRHPYHTRQTIYDRLVLPWEYGHPEHTQAMDIGSYFEPHVARYAAKHMGLKIRANSRTIEHKKVNLAATPDYWVLNEDMLLEIKVSGIMYGWNSDELHPWVEYQARAQMACANRSVVMVCALVGVSLYTIPVIRDMEKEETLLTAVDDFFHNHVLPNIRPTDEIASSIIATVGR